jgi:hypothetical protein
MIDGLIQYGVPFIFNSKSKEEKIEEARQSGLIGKQGDHDFIGAKYGQEIVCKRCGSRNVLVHQPIVEDLEKGVEIPYTCKDCGYEGTRAAKVKKLTDDGTLIVDLIPESLIGVEGYGSFLK